MAVCKCGEKLKTLYFKEGGGALECRGCGRYEDRRVASVKAILELIKELNRLGRKEKGYEQREKK